MKKHLLLILAAISFLTYQASAQTISLTGTNGIIAAGSTFTSHITLTITGANSIGNVESVNVLLGTPSTGVNSGASFFTVTALTPTSPFTLANANPATPASFTRAGDSANTGFLLSSTNDLGSNAPAGSAPTVAATGTTSFEVETITFTSLANTPAGTYNFRFSSGGFADAQGSFIENTSNVASDVNSTPVFTITIVPEPSTWALIAVSGAFLGVMAIGRRRAGRATVR